MKYYYGYHRTSTKQQHLDRGIKEIQDYCRNNNLPLERIYTDQQTGKNFDRENYRKLKRRIKKGDTLIISELDRLGRNKDQILKELRWFGEHNIRVMILELPTTLMDLRNYDDSLSTLVMSVVNNMLIELYAMMSEAEMKKRVKRQREGIEAKKARGEWADYGRPRKMALDQFQRVYEEGKKVGLSNLQIAEQNKIAKSTYYKYIKLLDTRST